MSWGRRFSFVVIGPLGGIAVIFGGSEKVFPNSDPYGGLSFYDRTFGLLASPTFVDPSPAVEGQLVFVIIFPHVFFLIKMEGLCHAMIFLYGRIMVLGELLTG